MWPARPGWQSAAAAATTPNGPVRSSRSSATGCSGMRTAIRPDASVSDHARVGCAGRTSVSGPGQKSSISRRASVSTSAMPETVAIFGTITGIDRSARPFASRRAWVPRGLKASAAIP